MTSSRKRLIAFKLKFLYDFRKKLLIKGLHHERIRHNLNARSRRGAVVPIGAFRYNKLKRMQVRELMDETNLALIEARSEMREAIIKDRRQRISKIKHYW